MGEGLMLHITNGDAAVPLLLGAVGGEILPWRDVLHEGPVRAGLSLEELSSERAAFIAKCGWAPLEAVEADFRRRDATLTRSHEEVVLWFEHDLYDQLQLIQLLDWFAAHPHPKLSLVCEAEYLGDMKPARAAELFARRSGVTGEQLAEGRQAWGAFTAPDPHGLERVPCSHLRFLGAALRRHLEELPWAGDGLSRTERAILRSLPGDFSGIFAAIREDPAYLGDSVLAWHLARLQREGLVEEQGGRWRAIERSERRREPRWLGGVCVTADSPWCWDAARGRVRALR
jgi:hypothetical protein